MFDKKRLDFGCALWGDEEVDYSYGNKYDLSLFFEYLICYKGVSRFYFTNFKRFNKFCWEILTELKVGYPHINRVWVEKNYGINVFGDNYPIGCSLIDFDDRLFVEIKNPKTSVEESVGYTKAILKQTHFNIFCFNPISIKSQNISFNNTAYQVCIDSEKKVVYNVYVPYELRKYQPI